MFSISMFISALVLSSSIGFASFTGPDGYKPAPKPAEQEQPKGETDLTETIIEDPQPSKG